jgi:hypothetical protein
MTILPGILSIFFLCTEADNPVYEETKESASWSGFFQIGMGLEG